jgi:hypothetical protein
MLIHRREYVWQHVWVVETPLGISDQEHGRYLRIPWSSSDGGLDACFVGFAARFGRVHVDIDPGWWRRWPVAQLLHHEPGAIATGGSLQVVQPRASALQWLG